MEWTQISRSIAATGHAARRGQPVSFKSIYAILIAPFWWIHSTAVAYAAIKYANVVIMTFAAVPTYLLARMLVSRRGAIAAALLAVAVPAMSYVTTIIIEVAAYPYYALARGSRSEPSARGAGGTSRWGARGRRRAARALAPVHHAARGLRDRRCRTLRHEPPGSRDQAQLDERRHASARSCCSSAASSSSTASCSRTSSNGSPRPVLQEPHGRPRTASRALVHVGLGLLPVRLRLRLAAPPRASGRSRPTAPSPRGSPRRSSASRSTRPTRPRTSRPSSRRSGRSGT